MLMSLVDSLILTVVTNIEGGLGSRLRYLYYRPKLKSCGGYFTTGAGFRMEGCDKIEIGRGCSFNHGVFIGVNEGIRFGNYCMVGPYCVFRDANHGYADRKVPMKFQANTVGRIHVGYDVWIGSHVVVLKGSRIGRGSIVAAHSLVNKTIGEYEVWGGVPAKLLKVR